MSAIAEAMKIRYERGCQAWACRYSVCPACRDVLHAAGRAITTSSQAAASGNVTAGAPRTWAVRWWHVLTRGWAADLDDDDDGSIVVYADDAPNDNVHPCCDPTARVWRWGSPACDPRGCAWPRPWAGGEVRRG